MKTNLSSILPLFRFQRPFFSIAATLSLLSWCWIGSPSAIYAESTNPLLAEVDILNVLVQRLQADRVYENFTKPACLTYKAESRADDHTDFVVREKHSGTECPGDPAVAPVIDRFRIMTEGKKILWYDAVAGDYEAYDPDKIKR